jgi:hypothetical protein
MISTTPHMRRTTGSDGLCADGCTLDGGDDISSWHACLPKVLRRPSRRRGRNLSEKMLIVLPT